MTKAEAIKFIQECSKNENAPYGFFVCAISREDIANHCNDEVVEEFDKLSKKKKSIVLSNIANEMQEKYEDYTFQEDFVEDLDIELYKEGN